MQENEHKIMKFIYPYNIPCESKSKEKNQFSIILQNILRTVKKVAEDRKLKKEIIRSFEIFHK